MEENKNIEEKTEEKKAIPEQVVKARLAWEEFRKKLENEGKKITEKEKEAQEKLIKKGKLPPQKDKPQIPPEVIREIVNAKNYSAELAKIIGEIEEYKKAGIDVSGFIREGKGIVALLAKIPTEEAQKMVNLFDAVNKPPKPEAPIHIQEVARKAWQEVNSEKLKRGESISDEEREAIDDFVRRGMGPIRGGSGEDEGVASGGNAVDLSSGLIDPDRAQGIRDADNQRLEEERRLYEQEMAYESGLSRGRAESGGERVEARPASSYEQEYLRIQQALYGELREEVRNGKAVPVKTEEGKESTDELRESLRNGDISEYLDKMDEYKTSQRGRKKQTAFQEVDLSRERAEVLSVEDEGEFRKKLSKLVDSADNYRFRQMMAERGFSAPTSIQEIAYDIIATDLADYGTGGEFALFERSINSQTGKEYMHFQQHNFLEWARNKMWKWDDDNPDSQGDMFKIIGIFGAIRGVSLGEMVLTPGFFRDKDSGEILDDLKTQLVYEAWPYDKFRNYDIQYRGMKGSDEKLTEVIGPIYAENVATKPDVFNKLFSLPNLRKGFENPEHRDPAAGEALKMALLSYYYLADGEMLGKIMQKDGKSLAFFNNKAFEDQYLDEKKKEGNYDDLSKEKQIELVGKIKNDFMQLSRLTRKYFDDNGELIKKENTLDSFIKDSNLFSSAMQDTDTIRETRERLRFSLMEKFGIDYKTARHIEVLSYKMTRWTGIASKNDTNAIGFDAWSKILNTSDYLKGQSEARKGGAYGNKHTMFQFKRFGVDFFTGISAMDGKSILEHIQGGQGDFIDFEKQRKNKDTMRFGENTMTQFFSNHINRNFQLFHSFVGSKALKLHEMVHTDNFGNVNLDPEKFDELFKEGFLKPMRYAWSTWPSIDFTEEVRTMVEVEVIENGKKVKKKVFKQMPIARTLFGKEMFDNEKFGVMLKYEELPQDKRIFAKDYYWLVKRKDDAQKGGKEPLTEQEENYLKENQEKYESEDFKKEREIVEKMHDAFVKGPGGRQVFWKEAAKVRIAAELMESRRKRNLRKRMTFEEVEQFIFALEKMDADVVGGEESIGDAKATGRFFSKEDIKWIRKKSGTGFVSMGLKEVGWSIAEGSPEGFLKALAMLFSNTFKSG